jgi:hypothetical protein
MNGRYPPKPAIHVAARPWAILGPNQRLSVKVQFHTEARDDDQRTFSVRTLVAGSSASVSSRFDKAALTISKAAPPQTSMLLRVRPPATFSRMV